MAHWVKHLPWTQVMISESQKERAPAQWVLFHLPLTSPLQVPYPCSCSLSSKYLKKKKKVKKKKSKPPENSNNSSFIVEHVHLTKIIKYGDDPRSLFKIRQR